ncbi:mitochondrial carrier domain-containing protein [Baffinella frigidus]|nr:mitochondrial carrier domain-containing protein [Cryptophyta sp. CCMP2293]
MPTSPCQAFLLRDLLFDAIEFLVYGKLYPAFLLRDLPFDAIEFLAYEQLRLIYLATLASGGQIGDVETAVIGALAGGITGALTCPLDTIRARTMNEAGLSDRLYDGPFETAKAIVEEEGVAALFSGVVPRDVMVSCTATEKEGASAHSHALSGLHVVWLSLGGTVFFSSLEAARSFFAAL